MTKEEKYQLARWAMNHALEKGARQAGVSISNSRSSSVEVRDKKIDQLEQAIQSSLTIRLYVDNKYSAHSTNRLKKENLAVFIEEAIAATRFLSEDKHRTLPDPDLYYKGEPVNMQTVDPGFDRHTPQTKIEQAFTTEKEILGKDKRIISVSAGYSDMLSERVMVTSNGFEGDSSRSFYGLQAQVSVNGGNARPESYWSESALFYKQLKKEGVGKQAMERALRKMGQRKIASAQMPMIVENRQVSRLLSPLISALSGSAIQQRNSFLTDKLEQPVFSEKLTITDDPFIRGGHSSRLFDHEGLATRKRKVMDKGILKTWYIDTYYAKKLQTAPTSGSTTNLVFNAGEQTLEELISSIETGILVTGFNGGNCNGSTGDFSYGIEGFLIENGKLSQPVSEMNITGNMITLWSQIGAIARDSNLNSSWRTPSILFEGVDFSGA